MKVVGSICCYSWFGFFLVNLLCVAVSWERGGVEDLTKDERGWGQKSWERT